MEQKKIYIYDPEERPFGALSNNARYSMYINEKTWPTVTNYILSNMLITPLYREIMQNSPIEGASDNINIKEKVDEILANVFVTTGKQPTKQDEETARHIVLSLMQENKFGIYDRYEFFLEKEYIDTVTLALQKGYSARLENNSEMKDILISTGTRPILYSSSNKVLGTGPDGNGMNILGLILMQLRKFYRTGKIAQKQQKKLLKKERELIKLYKAYIFLANKLDDGLDISDYFNESALDIPDEELTYITESNDEILKKILNNNLPFIQEELNQPGAIARYLFEKKEKETEAVLRKFRNERILEIYTAYVIRKNKPNLPIEEVDAAAKQLMAAAPSYEEYINLSKTITELYFQGKLNEEVTEIIKDFLEEKPEVYQSAEQGTDKTSSSSDPIKQMFTEENEKLGYAKKLESYTGKSYKKLMKKSLDKLKKMLSQYEKYKGIKDLIGVEPSPIEEEKGNVWLVQYKLKNGRKQLIKKVVGEKPDKNAKMRILEKYNRKNNTNITIYQLFVDPDTGKGQPKNMEQIKEETALVWQVKLHHSDGRIETLDTLYTRPNESVLTDIAKKLNFSEPIQVTMDPSNVLQKNVTYIYTTAAPLRDDIDETQIIKPLGEPVFIFPMLEQNKEEFKIFSPLFIEEFTVDNEIFPSITMYITTMLITQTGVKSVMSRDRTFKRGMSVKEAKAHIFDLSLEDATRKYEELKASSFKELMHTFAKIAIDVKFKNIALRNLLKLTGKDEIIWNDPHNIFLGAGTPERPGENFIGELLMQMRASLKKEKIELNYTQIKNFLSDDVFVKEWAKKRISDMCSTVSKVYTLAKSKGYSEELTPPFVENVLDTIFIPCTAISSLDFSFITSPPDEFILHIKGCGNFPVKSLEIDRKIEEKKRDILSSEKEEFHIPIETRRTIEKNMLTEWSTFVQNLLGEKDEEFIEEKVQQLKKQQKERETPQDSKELFKERLKLWSSLQNKVSKKDAQKAIIQFNNLQQKTLTQLLEKRLPKDKIATINNKISENKAELFELQKQKKDIDRNYKFLSNEICQVYWERIVYMIYFLTKYVKKSTEENVRKAIYDLEQLNSVAKECEFPYKLKNKEDTCIVSALYNILKNLDSFFSNMEIEYELSVADIKLAEKIILGQKKKGTKSKKSKVAEEKDEKDEEKLDTIEEEPEISEESSTDLDDNSDSEKDGYESDENSENELVEIQASFGMGKLKNKHNGIESVIRDLTNNKPLDNLDELIEAFEKSVEVIKNVKINPEIKINRINFFATT